MGSTGGSSGGRLRRLILGAVTVVTVTAVRAQPMSYPDLRPKILNDVRYASRYATGGNGTSGSPWTGWESVVAADTLVKFSKGFYSTAGITITNLDNVTLEGDGADATEIRCTSTTGNCLSVDLSGVSAANNPTIAVRGILFKQTANMASGSVVNFVNATWRATMENVQIDCGENGGVSCSSGTALSLVNVQNMDVSGLHVRGYDASPFGVGVDIGNAVSVNRGNIAFHGGLIYAANTAVRVAKDATNVVNNVSFYGMKIVGDPADVDGIIGYYLYARAKEVGLYSVHVENCERAIYVSGADRVFVSGANISQFANNGVTGTPGNEAAVDIIRDPVTSADSDNVSVINCAFENNVSSGTAVRGDGNAHSGLFVLGNAFTNVTAQTSVLPATPVESPTKLRITGDDFWDALTLRGTTTLSSKSPNLRLMDNQASPQSVYLRKESDKLVVLGNDGAVGTSKLRVGELEGVRFANEFATGGTGSSGSPWTGWSAVFTGAERVHFPAGYYSGDVSISTGGELRITGDGMDKTVWLSTTADGDALRIDYSGIGPTARFTSRVAIEDIGFKQSTTALSSGAVVLNIFDAPVVTMKSVLVDADSAADLTSSGVAIALKRVYNATITDPNVRAYDSPGGRFAVGIDIGNVVTDNVGSVTITGGFVGRSTIGIRVAEGMTGGGHPAVNGINILGTKLTVNGSGVPQSGTVGIELNQQVNSALIAGVYIEGYGSRGIDILNADGVTVQDAWIAHFGFDAASRGILVRDVGVTNLVLSGLVISGSTPTYNVGTAIELGTGLILTGARIGEFRTADVAAEFLDNSTRIDGSSVMLNDSSGTFKWKGKFYDLGRGVDDNLFLRFITASNTAQISWVETGAQDRFEVNKILNVAGQVQATALPTPLALGNNTDADISMTFDQGTGTDYSLGWHDAVVEGSTTGVFELGQTVYVSPNTLATVGGTSPTVLRVGERAQTTGDSRTLGYFSEIIAAPGGTESQAVYGINEYTGAATVPQIGVHGIAQGNPGAATTQDTITGVQARGTFLNTGAGGVVSNLFGTSSIAETAVAASYTGTVTTAFGVYGGVNNRLGNVAFGTAYSVFGERPRILGGTGTIANAQTAFFRQPVDGTSTNYALVLGAETAVDIVQAFKQSTGAYQTLRWDQAGGRFRFNQGLQVNGNFFVVGDNTAQDLTLVKADVTGTDKSLVWDDTPGQFEFDFDAVLNDKNDVVITTDTVITPSLAIGRNVDEVIGMTFDTATYDATFTFDPSWAGFDFSHEISVPDLLCTNCIELSSETSGTLAVANGGTGLTTSTTNAVMIGNGTTTWEKKVLPNCASGGEISLLHYNNTTHEFSCDVLTKVCLSWKAVAANPAGAGATEYISLLNGAVNATRANVDDMLTPAAFSFHTLQVKTDVAPGTDNSFIFTLEDDATATTLTCPISGASATSCSDTTHEASVTAASKINILMTSTDGDTANPAEVLISLCTRQ